MKNLKIFLTLTLAMVTSITMAQISGTAHDFSAAGWITNGEICIACHTPHNADDTVADSPLWNHEVTTATHTPYASGGTMNAVPGAPSGVSLLCLSCHDGTVALDSYGGTAGTVFIGGGGTPSGPAWFGVDLSNEHPISFTYDAALVTADGELNDPTAEPIASWLVGGSLECSSCHDVHGTGVDALLNISNAGSALCLTCHAK